jgi:hypothetical protein
MGQAKRRQNEIKGLKINAMKRFNRFMHLYKVINPKIEFSAAWNAAARRRLI